jgi:hypothetical protein
MLNGATELRMDTVVLASRRTVTIKKTLFFAVVACLLILWTIGGAHERSGGRWEECEYAMAEVKELPFFTSFDAPLKYLDGFAKKVYIFFIK